MPAKRAFTNKRSYTNEQKAQAVGLATVKSQEAAALELGIPRKSISNWVHDPAFAEIRDASRDDLASAMWVGIQIGVMEVISGMRGEATLRDKATALGILYDKHALLTGAATSRTESRDLTGTLSDLDLIAALRAADEAAGAGRDPAPAAVPPAGE